MNITTGSTASRQATIERNIGIKSNKLNNITIAAVKHLWQVSYFMVMEAKTS
jgi:hypothetical protein